MLKKVIDIKKVGSTEWLFVKTLKQKLFSQSEMRGSNLYITQLY